MPDSTKLFIRPGSSIREVMAQVSLAGKSGLPSGIALLVSETGVLEGLVTDGDIRRALLAGADLDGPADGIATRDPILFDSKMSHRQILEEIPRRLAEKGRYRRGVIEKIVLVDESRRVETVLDFIDLWHHQNMRHRHISITGMGFVGLTLAVTLADSGFFVTGVEQSEKVRKSLQAGRPHFHEVGLEALLNHHVGTSLDISTDPPREAEVYFMAVGTPLGEGKKPDTSDVRTASKKIGEVLAYGDLVILRSTVPVGTCRGVVLPILEEESGLKCGRDFYLAFAPERTVEGRALQELRTLPQVVGGYDANSADLTASLFREMTPSIVTAASLEEAEMVKLVNNSFRDLTFAFANELVLVCEHFGLDAAMTVNVANDGYPRNRIPSPSPGVGGVCLKKDPYIFADVAKTAGLETCLSEHGRSVNERMPGMIVGKVEAALEKAGKRLDESKIFLIGFAYKGEPETSDMRDSTTLDILALLHGRTKILGFDPVVPASELAAIGVKPCSIEEGFAGADCAILVNNHRSYADIDIFACLKSMNRPAVYCDCWRVFAPKDVAQVGQVTYLGLGFSVEPG